jgi:hypothetical protein
MVSHLAWITKASQIFMATYKSTPSTADPPSITLSLKPRYGNNTNDISSLAASMQIRGLSYTANGPFLSMPLNIANVPCNKYDGDDLKVFDNNGLVPLLAKDDERKVRTWYTSRPSKADYKVKFEAFPRKIDQTTSPGPRIDLRTDLEGGLTGAGVSFTPLPVTTNVRVNITVEWNLTSTPKGTTAIWTFGESEAKQQLSSFQIRSD